MLRCITLSMRLRAHHLICLHFFKGEGYSREYVENLKKVVERAMNEEIEVIFGADEVCHPCPFLKDGFCVREEVADLDLLAMKLLNVKPGDRITWSYAEEKLKEVLGIWKRYACFDCEYKSICSRDGRWKNER
jgi:hypothetical protein